MKHDLHGKRFGRLEAIYFKRKPNRRSAWVCRCDCGKEKLIDTASLLRGLSKSCGCMAVHNGNDFAYRHGLWKHPLRGTWRSMKQRCLNPKSHAYKNYGGRGITICDRWLSFESFVYDNENLAKPGTSLERLDNDGPYSPENCCWASPQEQARNTSGNNHITYLGRTQTLAEWAEEKNLPYYVLSQRIYDGWPIDRAINTPQKSRSILCEDDVVEIRKESLLGTARNELASRFGVKPSTIKSIVLRRSWKHVP